MRHAKQGTAYAGRRRTARPECNDGRLLSREDWEDCEVIARPQHGWRFQTVATWTHILPRNHAGNKSAQSCRLSLFRRRRWRAAAKQTSHYALPLDNMDVPVCGDTRELFDAFTWRGPMDLELIDLSGGADAEDFPEIVRREITATIVLKALARFTARFPQNARPDGV